MATITANNGGGTATPITVLSPYEATHQSRNVIHDLVGGGIAVSLVAPRPRRGQVAYLFPDEYTANQCAQLHRILTTFTLAGADAPTTDMTYVVDGNVSVALDQDTLVLWTVSVEYQEVSP